MIDLHVHTNISDGSFSPEEVVRMAAEKGITALAVTDHDTIAGIDRARTEAAALGVEFVAGVEVSTQWDHGILHMLGYFIDPNNPELLTALDYLKNGRQERIPKIISKLNGCGVRVSAEEVNELLWAECRADLMSPMYLCKRSMWRPYKMPSTCI